MGGTEEEQTRDEEKPALSIADELALEVEKLKGGKLGNAVKRRLVSVKTGVSGLLLVAIQDDVVDPIAVVEKLITNQVPPHLVNQ